MDFEKVMASGRGLWDGHCTCQLSEKQAFKEANEFLDFDWASPRPKKRAFKETITLLTSKVAVLSKKLDFLQKFDLDCLRDADITFVVDNQKVAKAHRFMLASRSSVFKQMFFNDMSEKLSGEIHVQDISGPVLQGLVKFLYTAEVTDEVCPVQLLMAAHKYNVPELQEKCEAVLCNLVCKENLAELQEFANVYSLDSLMQTCIILDRYYNIDGIMTLPLHKLELGSRFVMWRDKNSLKLCDIHHSNMIG